MYDYDSNASADAMAHNDTSELQATDLASEELYSLLLHDYPRACTAHLNSADETVDSIVCPPAFSLEKEPFRHELPLHGGIHEDFNDGDSNAQREKVERANLAEFAARWSESSASLAKTPLGPVVKELGDQLVSGKLDVAKLQKLIGEIQIPEDEFFGGSSKLLAAFREDIADMYGLDVSFDFRGKGDQVGLGAIRVSQFAPHAFNTSIVIPADGEVRTSRVFTEGIAGPIVKDIDAAGAMQALRGQIKAGRVDVRKQ